jgi:general nucleoside transport system permease protein
MYNKRLIYSIIGAVAIVAIIFVWRALGGTQPLIETVSLLVTTIAFACPILLGGLGGTFSERSGVVNIAIEGLMLNGAFFGALISVLTGQIWLGVIAAMLAGLLLSMLHAVLSIYFRVDQIISGTVINILAFGITSYLNKLLFNSGVINKNAGRLPELNFEIGTARFSVGILPIVAIMLVFVTQYILFNTRWGLRTRAVGENPKAADTAGINVFFMRYRNVYISGLLAGLGGAYFSLQQVGYFEEGMTVGLGFIALAAMIFGNWTPIGVLGASLIFAFSRALDGQIQIWYPEAVGWISYITGGLPYIVTIIVLTGLIGKSRPPAAVGVPYIKQ